MNTAQQHGKIVSAEAVWPSVAIVILNWNGKKFLEQFLPSVLAGGYFQQRVIIADNASTDNSLAFLRNNFPAVEIIQNPFNEGFAKGYNSALKKIDADYYVLLNSDVEVTTGWINPIITLMESDKTIAACQPKILSCHDRDQFEYAGASGGWIDSFGYPFTRGRVMQHCEKDLGQYDDAQPCFWATGAALFVRSSAYHEARGFDEYFFAHQEEIDLCWRLQLQGYKVYVQPASVVYHVGGGTLHKSNHRKTYLNYRNNMIMLYKNLRGIRRLWIIPLRIILNAIAAVKSLVAGDAGYFLAVAKAHRHFVSWWLFHKNDSLYAAGKNKDLKGWYKGNIIVDYFIRKKRTFSEIIPNK